MPEKVHIPTSMRGSDGDGAGSKPLWNQAGTRIPAQKKRKSTYRGNTDGCFIKKST